MRSGRNVLQSELSAYLVEFAEMEGVPVERSENGLASYRWFDRYWLDEDRLPFFIEDSGELAGFCLVRVIEGGWNIAEFGIRRERRRAGVGRCSVDVLASAARSAGASHLRADVHHWNERALRFWSACGFRPIGEAEGIVPTRLVLDPLA